MNIIDFIGEENVNKISFFVSAFQAIELIDDPQERLLGFETVLYYAFYGVEPDLKELPNSVISVYLTAKPIIDNSISSQIGGKKGGSNKKKKSVEENAEATFEENNNPLCENNLTPLEENSEAIRNRNRNKEKELEKEEGIGIGIGNRDKVDYRKIVDSFNSICVSYPQVTRLSDQRKKAIKSRVKEYDEDTVIRVFQMAEDSDFLKGKNDRGWSATFDWIMKPSNFLKIYEGHYMNTRSSPKKEFKTSNPFLQMLAEEGELFDDENRDYEDFSNSQSGISAQL